MGIALPPGEVHVWRIDLEPPAGLLRRQAATLEPDERARADRLAFPSDRVHRISAHGSVRRLLGAYLGIAPEAVRFRRAPGGKPHLATAGDLRFNLSHSGRTALWAVTRGREVGVDVERIRADRDVEGIARHFFAPAEVAVLRGLRREQRVAAFYRCWTRKEAYLKARGDPGALPLDDFEVALAPDAPCALLRASAPDEPRRWTLVSLTPPAGHAAALAVEGGGWTLRMFDAQSSWT